MKHRIKHIKFATLSTALVQLSAVTAVYLSSGTVTGGLL